MDNATPISHSLSGPPRLTSLVLGQAKAIESFFAAVQTGRLAHGWIFSGRQGVGKMLFAMQVARATLADGPPKTREELEAGQLSAESQLVDQAAHPDLRVVAPDYDNNKKQIEVEQIRDLKNFFAHSSARSKWRVAIIDAVDDMTRNAANALLKILEEPPGNTLIILINHNQGRLISTIRSRCRILPFRELEEEVVAKQLLELCPEADEQTRAAAAFLASGSLADAIFLINHGGFEHYKAMVEAMIALSSRDVEPMHNFANYVASKDDPLRFSAFIALLSDMIVRIFKDAQGAQPYRPLFKGEHEYVASLAGALRTDELFAIWEDVQQKGRETNALNLDRKQAVMTCFTMINSKVAADGPKQ